MGHFDSHFTEPSAPGSHLLSTSVPLRRPSSSQSLSRQAVSSSLSGPCCCTALPLEDPPRGPLRCLPSTCPVVIYSMRSQCRSHWHPHQHWRVIITILRCAGGPNPNPNPNPIITILRYAGGERTAGRRAQDLDNFGTTQDCAQNPGLLGSYPVAMSSIRPIFQTDLALTPGALLVNVLLLPACLVLLVVVRSS